MLLKSLSKEGQAKVIKLHAVAFGNVIDQCVPCGGACCKGCAQSNGYAPWGWPKEKIEDRKTKFGFDKELGFLSENGCKLPMEERSATCLGFLCAIPEELSERYRVRFFGQPKNPEAMKPWDHAQKRAAYDLREVFYKEQNHEITH